jgi:hypothetical protein
MEINDKIEEIRSVVEGIHDDAQKILSMIQMSTPVGEALIQRIVERANQVGKIFSPEESNGEH